MLDLAMKYGEGLIYLKDIAKDEDISEKYLSLIIIPLRASGLVNSSRGAKGGYSLSRPPEKITLKEVVDCLEGETFLVDCVKDPENCSRSECCASRDLWSIIGSKISELLASISLADLVAMGKEKKLKSGMYHI